MLMLHASLQVICVSLADFRVRVLESHLRDGMPVIRKTEWLDLENHNEGTLKRILRRMMARTVMPAASASDNNKALGEQTMEQRSTNEVLIHVDKSTYTSARYAKEEPAVQKQDERSALQKISNNQTPLGSPRKWGQWDQTSEQAL